MGRWRLTQEGLKLVACATMLLDHIGAVLVPGYPLRIIGRMAFPIYCFLLLEGEKFTHNPAKYGQRLLTGALLAEIPFDLLFYGRIYWQHQNVMLTLLIVFFLLRWIRRGKKLLLPFLACFVAAELLGTDYGGLGIGVILVFHISDVYPNRSLVRLLGLSVIFTAMGSLAIPVFGMRIPIQLFGLLALVPIMLYSGEKRTRSPWIQWGFYLFYPVHMILLILIRTL